MAKKEKVGVLSGEKGSWLERVMDDRMESDVLRWTLQKAQSVHTQECRGFCVGTYWPCLRISQLKHLD